MIKTYVEITTAIVDSLPHCRKLVIKTAVTPIDEFCSRSTDAAMSATFSVPRSRRDSHSHRFERRRVAEVDEGQVSFHDDGSNDDHAAVVSFSV